MPPLTKSDLKTSTTFFQSSPWLSPLLSDPSTTRLFLPDAIQPKTTTTEDALFSRTITSPTTILHALSLHPVSPDTIPHLTECTTLFSLGSDLDGWPGILHGGMVATLHDECTGVLIQEDGRRWARLVREGTVQSGGELKSAFTTKMDVRYLSPVLTPGLVKVVVRVEAREGRWIRLRAEMFQWREESAEEVLCSTAVTEFVGKKIAKL